MAKLMPPFWKKIFLTVRDITIMLFGYYYGYVIIDSLLLAHLISYIIYISIALHKFILR